jgi:hypothetical protein
MGMMTLAALAHPSVDDLVDHVNHEGSIETLLHLYSCQDCRCMVRIFTEARPAFDPDIEVPTCLVDRVIAGIMALGANA